MTPRDKAILRDLERFRVLSRDHIMKMHFAGLKDPVRETNKALLRLRDRKEISVSKERRQYLYFPAESIRKDSAKIPHYLMIADFYLELCRYEKPEIFLVEERLGPKGYPEPDVTTIWGETAFFAEIQRSVYSDQQWMDKMNKYETYYHGGEWKETDWQLADPPEFPYFWVFGKIPSKTKQSFKVSTNPVDVVAKKLGLTEKKDLLTKK